MAGQTSLAHICVVVDEACVVTWEFQFTSRSLMFSFALRRRSTARFYHSLTTSDAQRSTIYALSTPPGKGGVAVIRVSGPEALAVWKHIVRPSRPRSSVQPWRMEYCRIVKPGSGSEETLDNGLAVFFKGPYYFRPPESHRVTPPTY